MTDNYYLHGALDGDTHEGETSPGNFDAGDSNDIQPGTLVATLFDPRPQHFEVTLGERIIETVGAVQVCRYPVTSPVQHGPVLISALEFIIWADSRFTFCWEAHNQARRGRHSIAFEARWTYRDSAQDPVPELGIPGLDYFRLPNQRWARRTRRRYNTAFQNHFHLLSRSDVQGLVRVTIQREA